MLFMAFGAIIQAYPGHPKRLRNSEAISAEILAEFFSVPENRLKRLWKLVTEEEYEAICLESGKFHVSSEPTASYFLFPDGKFSYYGVPRCVCFPQMIFTRSNFSQSKLITLLKPRQLALPPLWLLLLVQV